MAFLSSAAVVLPRFYTTSTLPKLSGAKFVSRDHHLVIHFISPRCDKSLIPSISTAVARAYLGNDSGTTDTIIDDGDSASYKQDWSGIQLHSEFEDDIIKTEIEKIENNSRLIRSTIGVRASLQTVWNVLTDYERLADFIPGLAVNQLLERRENFARLFQIGEQILAFGLKFNAKGTVDCFERDLKILPNGHRRDIEFKMVEGDFELFEGKWSVQQATTLDAEESVTMLSYIVHVKPKMWLPVQLVEGRLCNEIKQNLSCIRDQAEKSFHITNTMVQ